MIKIILLLALTCFANQLLVVSKVGDKKTVVGKEAVLKDGDPIQYLLESDWSAENWQKIITNNDANRVFCFTEWNEKDLPAIKKYLASTYEKARADNVSFSTLQAKTGIKDLERKLRDKYDRVPIIDCKNIPLKDVWKTQANPPAFDSNAIAAGAANVGPGETYTTWAIAFSDLANLTDSLFFTQTGNIAENSTSTITENLAGFKLKCTNGSPHLGDPTAGYKTTFNADADGFILGMEGPGIIEITNLNWQRITTAVTTSNNPDFFISAITTACTVKLNNLLIDGNEKSWINVYMNDAQAILEMYNCVLWDCRAGTNPMGVLFVAGDVANTKIENVASFGHAGSSAGYGFHFAGQAVIVKNLAAFDNSTNDFFSHSVAISDNSASEDATGGNGNWGTGANNITGFNPVTEFESIDPSNALFLKLTGVGSIFAAGATVGITANTTGIRGNARPTGDGNISISSDQFTFFSPSSGTSGPVRYRSSNQLRMGAFTNKKTGRVRGPYQ